MSTSLCSSPVKSLPSTACKLSSSSSSNSNSDKYSVNQFPISFPQLNPQSKSEPCPSQQTLPSTKQPNPLLKSLSSIQQDLKFYQSKWSDIQKHYKLQHSLIDQFYCDIVLYIQNLRQHHKQILKAQKQRMTEFLLFNLPNVSSNLQQVTSLISFIKSNKQFTITTPDIIKTISALNQKLKTYGQRNSKISNLTKSSLDDQFVIFLKVVNKMFGVKFQEGFEMFPKEEDKLNISLGSNIEWLVNKSVESIGEISIIQRLLE